MCFLISLVPATIWLIVGYFLLFAASRSVGGIKTFGQVVAIWTFVIAAVIPLAAGYVTLADLCPLEDMMGVMHSVRS